MLIQVLIGLGILGAGYAVSRKPAQGQSTPDRDLIFETAINEVQDPDKLRQLAAVFRSQGLNAQADLLEKRANLRELPSDVKVARREAYRNGMSSHDPAAIRTLANAFEKEGATGAATALREYANTLGPIAPNGGLSYKGPGIRPGPTPDAATLLAQAASMTDPAQINALADQAEANGDAQTAASLRMISAALMAKTETKV